MLRGAEGSSPFFSPSGDRVGFVARDNTLKTISIFGGPATVVSRNEPGVGLKGAAWGADDTIVFAKLPGSGLWTVPAAGGEPKPLTTVDREQGEGSHHWPEILPGAKGVLLTIWRNDLKNAQIAVLSLVTGKHKVLTPGSNPRYSPTGHVVYGLEGSLWAVAFDLDRLEAIGKPFPVLENVMTKRDGAVNFDLSDNGTLAYIHGGADELKGTLVWVDRRGHEEPLVAEPRYYRRPRVSPDGTRLAVEVVEPDNIDVWIYDLVRGTPSRLTFDPADDGRPSWTPDGLQVVFSSRRDTGAWGLFRQAADGNGQAERLTTDPNPDRTPYAFIPDGKSLVFNQRNPETIYDLYLLSMEGRRSSKTLIQTKFFEGSPALSHDGRWIAYVSGESGQMEVYVRPFPNVEDGKWPISMGGSYEPVWSPKGHELFYRSGEGSYHMMVVPYETEPTFKPGTPERLFTGRYFSGGGRQYDISPDGRQFLMIKEAAQQASKRGELIVVLNWFEELERLVPTAK